MPPPRPAAPPSSAPQPASTDARRELLPSPSIHSTKAWISYRSVWLTCFSSTLARRWRREWGKGVVAVAAVGGEGRAGSAPVTPTATPTPPAPTSPKPPRIAHVILTNGLRTRPRARRVQASALFGAFGRRRPQQHQVVRCRQAGPRHAG